jgi:hypothetical protein
MIPGSILNNPDAFAYTEYDFDFTATGASTTLQFEFQQDPAFFHLDDVDVEQNTTPGVPEPGTLALAGCGIVTFVGYRWRRRRQAS